MFTSLALAAASCAPGQPAVAPFEIKDGDRIVWIGSTLVEREQRFGYWEAALYAAFPKVNFTVRNLGWSGDTVWGESRAGFDPPAKGFERLVSLTLELKPTVIFVSYGANESFDGEAGLPRFEQGLNKLLDALKSANARVVLMSPLPFEIGRVPGTESRNRDIEKYSQSIGAIARTRGHRFVDLYDKIWRLYVVADKMNGATRQEKDWWYTDNGIHLRESGYERTAHLFREALGLNDTHRSSGPDNLRQAVIAKNQLFFYRWRPQNETYLFGFRKHEQGRNAKEVAEFDPLVAKAEAEIAELRRSIK